MLLGCQVVSLNTIVTLQRHMLIVIVHCCEYVLLLFFVNFQEKWGKETENIIEIYNEKLESLRTQLDSSKTETSDLVAKYYDYDRKWADMERE